MVFLLPSFLSLLVFSAHANPVPQPEPDVLVSHGSVQKRTWGWGGGWGGGGWGGWPWNQPKTYNISFYHINDVHARLDQFRSSGSSCTDPTKGCVGGYARVKTVIDKTRPTHHNSLFLNAGDEFQGTLFHTFYKGYATATVLNQLGFDAMTLGNHEFDNGDDLLGNFVENLTFPVISSNVHSKNRKLTRKLQEYLLFPQHDLAIVAVTTDTTPTTSSPANTTVFDPPVKAVQKTVDYIKKHHKNIKRFVALTHIGYDEDIKLASQTRDVSLIIGGHSHTLLGNITGALGPYPTIVKNLDGKEVFVVTSFRWGEYLGYIDIAYDCNSGKVLGYSGAPIHLTNTTTQEAKLQKQVNKLAEGFAPFASKVIGTTETTLVQTTCQKEECNLGDFTTDAMLAYREPFGTVIGLTNSGGIRTEIDAGQITLQQALECYPFGNTVVDLKFTGAELWKILEGTISKTSVFNGKAVTSAAQWSHTLRVKYNPSNPVGKQVISVEVAGKKLDPAQTYQVSTNDFLAGGGDNFWPAGTGGSFVTLKALDEVWSEAVTAKSPLNVKTDGRLSTTTETTPEFTF